MRQTLTSALFRIPLFVLLTSLSTSIVNAQDLSKGIKAPSNVKIDGKLTEWTAEMEYSKSTMLHYTMSNDAQNIYLALKCTDQPTINKILANGITIVLNKEAKKREKDALVLMYPVPNRAGGRGGFGGGRPGAGARGGNGPGNRQAGQGGTDTTSLITAHKRAIVAMKEFRITGVKSIADTTVSIYNTYGLKTVINIDDKANLVYELAIPLSLLDLSASQQTDLAFNVKVNGIDLAGMGMVDGNVVVEGFGRAGGGGGGGPVISVVRGGTDMMSATDFWGKYKLIK